MRGTLEIGMCPELIELVREIWQWLRATGSDLDFFEMIGVVVALMALLVGWNSHRETKQSNDRGVRVQVLTMSTNNHYACQAVHKNLEIVVEELVIEATCLQEQQSARIKTLEESPDDESPLLSELKELREALSTSIERAKAYLASFEDLAKAVAERHRSLTSSAGSSGLSLFSMNAKQLELGLIVDVAQSAEIEKYRETVSFLKRVLAALQRDDGIQPEDLLPPD